MTRNLPLLCLSLLAALAMSPSCAEKQACTDSVDPLIGSGFHGHVFVGANVPFGFIQAGPTSVTQRWDWCSGYHESENTVIGFSHTHLSGTGCGDLFDITVMPVVGRELTYARGTKDDPSTGLWSPADRTAEVAEPGYYSIPLSRYGILAEMTATERCAMHRYTFPASEESAIVVDLKNGGYMEHVTEPYAETVGDRAIRGWRYSTGWAKNQKIFFYAEFSKPFEEATFIAAEDESLTLHERMYTRLDFKTAEGESVLMKIALSPVSMEGAKMNLDAELPGWDFEKARRDASKAWEKELSKIRIEASDEVKTIFYTALYHAMIAPSLYNDVDRSYRGSDDKVYLKADFENYTTLSLWDTYRAEMPLLSIIEPERIDDMVRTMLKIYEQQGFLPIWHLMSNETYCMPGEASVIVIGDAIVKGFDGFDRDYALEAMKNSLQVVGRGNNLRLKYGYVPSDLIRLSIARDMEFAIADAAVSRAAEVLGQSEDADAYRKKSQSYRIYMDPETGFARGRFADGSWRTPFNPNELILHETDYSEGNAWQYSFLAPQDVDWLIDFYGGNEGFVTRLDSLFTTSSRLDGRGFGDMTGMIGQYVHGNEPSHHIIYLYTMAGCPWKAADRLREVMSTLYTTGRDGLCGNEDVGQMSAWYVLSALGFYQVEPASTRFWFGSPIVDKAEIDVGGGKTFCLGAVGNSAENRYIQRITLNGKPYNLPYIDFADMKAGSRLVLEMGPEPRKWY